MSVRPLAPPKEFSGNTYRELVTEMTPSYGWYGQSVTSEKISKFCSSTGMNIKLDTANST